MNVGRTRRVQTRPFPSSRRLVTVALRAGRRMTPMYGLVEVDVTKAKQILARHDPPSSLADHHDGQALQAAWRRRVQRLGGLSSGGSQSSGCKPRNAAWNLGSQGKRPSLSAHTTCRYGGLTKP